MRFAVRLAAIAGLFVASGLHAQALSPWETLGQPINTYPLGGFVAPSQVMLDSHGSAYVGFDGTSDDAAFSISRYDEATNAWVDVMMPQTPTPSRPGTTAFAMGQDDNIYFAACTPAGAATRVLQVFKFDTLSGEVAQVGDDVLSGVDTLALSLARDSTGQLYLHMLVVPDNPAEPAGIVVYRWDGSAWGQLGGMLGTNLESNPQGPEIQIGPDDVPYVVTDIQDGTDGTYQGKLVVFKFENGDWTVVGGAPPSPGRALWGKLLIENDRSIYLAYNDNEYGISHPLRISVQHFDGSSWSYVGERSFTSDRMSEPTGIGKGPGGTLYVGAGPFNGEGSLLQMYQFTDGAWSSFDLSSYTTARDLWQSSMAIDRGGSIYVTSGFYGSAEGSGFISVRTRTDLIFADGLDRTSVR